MLSNQHEQITESLHQLRLPSPRNDRKESPNYLGKLQVDYHGSYHLSKPFK